MGTVTTPPAETETSPTVTLPSVASYANVTFDSVLASTIEKLDITSLFSVLFLSVVIVITTTAPESITLLNLSELALEIIPSIFSS